MTPRAPASSASRADLVLLAATVGWGLTFPIVKDALSYASPGAFLVARFFLGAAVALFIARRQLRDRTSLRYGAILGLFLWSGFALNTWGSVFTTATRAGFVTSLAVVLVPVLGALFFRLRASVSAYVGAGLATVGLIIMSGAAVLESSSSLLGDLLIVGSAITYSFHILLTGLWAPRIRPAPAVAAQLTVTALLSLTLLPFEDVRFVPSVSLIGTLLFCGIFASALFIFMQIWAQARTSAVRAALIFTLEPVLAAVFSYFIVHDPLVPATLGGGALIVGGILIAEFAPRLLGRPPHEAPEISP